MPTFIAIDVETANASRRSICQIGIAKFINGKLVEEWTSLIDPETNFGPIQVSIHGINSRMVVGQPKLPEVAEHIRYFLENEITVCHTLFDKQALFKAFEFYDLKQISTTWLDSAEVAKIAWGGRQNIGYKLSDLCKMIEYNFIHHDALEDAKAAGFVLLAAIKESNIDIHTLIERVEKASYFNSTLKNNTFERIKFPEKKPDSLNINKFAKYGGKLSGEVIVFSGDFENGKNYAEDKAVSVGFDVHMNITRKTTILVIGSRDATSFGGREKSGKQLKAEQLASAGFPIKIIFESDFNALIEGVRSLV